MFVSNERLKELIAHFEEMVEAYPGPFNCDVLAALREVVEQRREAKS